MDAAAKSKHAGPECAGRAETDPLGGSGAVRGLRMPVSFVYFSIRALIATTAELPDVANTAMLGPRRNG